MVSSFTGEEIAFCAIILISVNVYYLCCIIFVEMNFNLEVLQEQQGNLSSFPWWIERYMGQVLKVQISHSGCASEPGLLTCLYVMTQSCKSSDSQGKSSGSCEPLKKTAKKSDPVVDSNMVLFILLNVCLVLAFISYKLHWDWSQCCHRLMLIL